MSTAPHETNFRSVLGRLPTGVVVVTGGDEQAPSGLVVGSFMSVSLDPPLVAVCPARSSTSWPAIEASQTFCANVLHHSQTELARKFAKSGGDKFADVEFGRAPATGSPLLEGVAAWIDCRVHQTIDAGDHIIVLGEVLELAAGTEDGALVFHAGSLKSLL